MSNVAISELSDASSLNNNDFLLISKNNGNGSFTSAKISGNNLNGLSKIRITDNDVTVYVSTTGSDYNIEDQFKNYGTSTQRNYPLYSLNAAIDFLWKFRASKRINYYIVMNSGTYTYNKRQVLAHPDTNCTFYINKNSSGLSNNVIINASSNWISEEQGTLSEHAAYSNCMLLTTVGYWRLYNLELHSDSITSTGCKTAIFSSVNSDVMCDSLNISTFNSGLGVHNKSYFILSNSSISNVAFGISMQHDAWMILSGTNITNSTNYAIKISDTCSLLFDKGDKSTMNIESSNVGLAILTGSKCMFNTFSGATLNIKGGNHPLVSTKYDGTTNTSLIFSEHQDAFYNDQGHTVNLIKPTNT